MNKFLFPTIFNPKPVQDLFDKIESSFYDVQSTYPYNIIQVKNKDNKVEKICLEVALAGFLKEEISIKVVNDELRIDVDKKRDEDASYIYLHHGIAQRSLKLAFSLWSNADVKQLKCVFKDGLLSIEIPIKVEDAFNVSIS